SVQSSTLGAGCWSLSSLSSRRPRAHAGDRATCAAQPRGAAGGRPATFPYATYECAAKPHACCGVVSNGCCDVSAPRATVFKLSAAPLPPPKPVTVYPTSLRLAGLAHGLALLSTDIGCGPQAISDSMARPIMRFTAGEGRIGDFTLFPSHSAS